MIELDRSWKALTEPGDATEYAFERAAKLELPGPTFSKALAIAAAEASRLAYNPRREVREAALARGGFTELAHLEQRSSVALILADPSGRILFVAYRGTDEPEDWKLNLSLTPVPWGDGRAHRGFAAAHANLEATVAEFLSGRKEAIVLTGHSQGGAVASLAATRLRPAAVYTLGAPRAATESAFAPLLGIPNFRIVNDLDPVPELPPGGPPFHFTHCGTRIVLGESGVTDEPPPSLSDRIEGFGRALFDRAAWLRRKDSAPRWLSDHAPVNYVARLLR